MTAQPIWMLGGRPLPEHDPQRFAFEQTSTDEPWREERCASCGEALCSHDDWNWRCPPGLLPTIAAIAAECPPAHASGDNRG